MRPMRFSRSYHTVADASGSGTITVTTVGPHDWVIEAATVSAAASAVKQSAADLYLGGTLDSSRVDGTYTGNKDTVRGVGTLTAGDTLTCVWSGADPGIPLTLRLQVRQYEAGTSPPDAAAYTPFSNSVVGGTTLVRSAIQSPGYTAGVQGWSINANGSVEFNSGSFRGAVLLGGPPATGAVSIGLTGTAIPAVLTGFSADYTWYEADVYWIDATQFFWRGLVRNTAFAVTQVMAGVYTTGGGVQIQTITESTTPNTLHHGSAVYDTNRLQEDWRSSDVALDGGCTLTLNCNLTMAAGTAVVADTWHTATLSNGWTGTLRYRQVAAPGNGVWVFAGSLTPGTKTDGTSVFTLPAGYRPLANCDLKCAVNTQVGAGQSPHMAINAGNGVVSCWGWGSATGGSCGDVFPLD